MSFSFKVKSKRVRISKIPEEEKRIPNSKRKIQKRRLNPRIGKPKKWDPSLLPLIFDLVSKGVKASALPYQLGISEKRWDRWREEHPEINAFIDRARSVVPQINAARYDDYNLTPTQRRFLIAYEKIGTIVATAKALGIDRSNHTLWLKSDTKGAKNHYNPDYAEAFQIAEKIVNDRLEAEIERRATRGLKKYKFHNGKPIYIDCPPTDPEAIKIEMKDGKVRHVKHYYEVEYSDTLLMFLTKKRMPEYRDKSNVEVEVKGTVLMELVDQSEQLRRVEVIDAEYIKSEVKKIEVQGQGDE